MIYLYDINHVKNKIKMNTVTGNSAKKEHWSRGATTACNRKMSTGKSDTEIFKLMVQSKPEMCCSKCLAQFKRKYPSSQS